MAKIKIELDAAVVEAAINVKVEPAVSEIIAKRYDLKQLIVDELEKASVESGYVGHGGVLLGMLPSKPQPLIDRLVRSAIQDAAQAFVQFHVEEHKAALSAAFLKMMTESADQMARAFVSMMESGDINLQVRQEITVRSDRDD